MLLILVCGAAPYIKCQLFPGRMTWYDWHTINAFGLLMHKWGSLRLMSQEAMEAWQKQLNDILRRCNGFANAGRYKKAIAAAGQAAIDRYLAERKDHQKAPEQWVYDKALMQKASHFKYSLDRMKALSSEGRVMTWAPFNRYWVLYMKWSLCLAQWKARLRIRADRAHYTQLLVEHRRYYAQVANMMSATDLRARDASAQQRTHRRKCYIELRDESLRSRRVPLPTPR